MEKVSFEQFQFEVISNRSKKMSVIESLLYVCGEPISIKEIAKIIECPEEETKSILEEMTKLYETDEKRGLNIITIDGMVQFVTKASNSDEIYKLLKKNSRQSLSQASLESLAIIAYKQPVTRIDIDEIRGVKSDSAIQKLLERNLIKEKGRLEVPGRPILYGTTDEFLRQFGLENLKELPSLDIFPMEEPHYEE